jgi:hypothetical protein
MESTITVTIVFTFTASEYGSSLDESRLVDGFLQGEIPLPKDRRLLSISMQPASGYSPEREQVKNLLRQARASRSGLTGLNQEEVQ